MPGLPLAAIGAGLGQFAQDYRQQQELQDRRLAQQQANAMLALNLFKFNKEMEQYGLQKQGAAANFGFATGSGDPLGGGGAGIPGGLPGSQPLPDASGLTPGGTTGGVPNSELTDAALVPRLQAAGAIKPDGSIDFAKLGARGPSGGAPAPQPAAQRPAFAPFPAAAAASAAPAPPPARQAMAGGYPTNQPVATPSAGPQDAEAGDYSGGAPTARAQTADASAPAGGDLNQILAKIPLPQLSDPARQIAQRINQLYPNASPELKNQILENQLKLRGPQEAERYRAQVLEYTSRREAATKMWEQQNKQRQQADENWETLTDPTNSQQYMMRKGHPETAIDLTGKPYKPGGAAHLAPASAAEKSSTNIKVTDAEGKVLFQGAAHKVPGTKPGESSWVDDKNQQRIDVPEDASVTMLGKGAEGRQAAAQMVRLTSAANEARRQIANVARASTNSTRSWFQGVEAETGSGLGEGLRRTLANEITPRDAQIMAVLGRGIGRSLSSLETAGAATGLIALTNSMQQNVPAKGDDIATALTKLAEMRQIAEQGIESAIAAPSVAPNQAKLLKDVLGDIQKAVPFTVADVLDLIQEPGTETYQSFAAKIGLGKKGDAAESDAPIIQNGWRYDPKTHQSLGPVQ